MRMSRQGMGPVLAGVAFAAGILGPHAAVAQGMDGWSMPSVEELKPAEPRPTPPSSTPSTPPPSTSSGEGGVGLHICNRTNVTFDVAVGYSTHTVLASEGWWNLAPGECKTPIGERLIERYFYYRAEANGGDFNGDGNYFCTTKRPFTIARADDCAARGFESEEFRRFETDGRGSYTLNITDPPPLASDQPSTGGTLPTTGEAASNLRICNGAGAKRYLAIGYSQNDQWVSEGWWNLDPGECATPVSGDLTQRYYYYRAEDTNEYFQGNGYMFCTVDEAFTIYGDENCQARGYEEHPFSEIDTGPTAPGYVYVIRN